MGKRKDAAGRIRFRFLSEKAGNYLQFDHPVALFWAEEAIEEMEYLLDNMYYIPLEVDSNGVTDEMIDAARNHPITNLIDFSRGNAVAFCHEDKRPSMFHAKRIGKAACPVCNKYFNAVDVLIERDGYSFIDAVRALQ